MASSLAAVNVPRSSFLSRACSVTRASSACSARSSRRVMSAASSGVTANGACDTAMFASRSTQEPALGTSTTRMGAPYRSAAASAPRRVVRVKHHRITADTPRRVVTAGAGSAAVGTPVDTVDRPSLVTRCHLWCVGAGRSRTSAGLAYEAQSSGVPSTTPTQRGSNLADVDFNECRDRRDMCGFVDED